MTDVASEASGIRGPRRSRRQVVGSLVGLAVGAGTVGLIQNGRREPPAPHPSAPGRPAPESWWGARQPGVTSPPLPALTFIALDLSTAAREGLRTVLTNLSDTAGRIMTASSDAPVTVTIGLGPTLFTDGGHRFGLAAKQPAGLLELPAFARDKLERSRCGGQLCLQICASDPTASLVAARQLLNSIQGLASPRWWQDGFIGPDTSHTPRNVLGFKDGTANPPAGTPRDAVVWVDDGSWMTNGTYLVVRRIRTNLSRWEPIGDKRQERIIGRTKTTGAPLSSGLETDKPDFNQRDTSGALTIGLDAHIRLANISFTKGAQIHRRGYNFNDPDPAGPGGESGLFFLGYQADPLRGFIPIQQRLAASDALNPFITHTGSAIFAIPPGANQGSYIGQALLQP